MPITVAKYEDDKLRWQLSDILEQAKPLKENQSLMLSSLSHQAGNIISPYALRKGEELLDIATELKNAHNLGERQRANLFETSMNTLQRNINSFFAELRLKNP